MQKEAAGALLQWEVGQAEAGQNFTIERSINGTSFTVITKLNATTAGNSYSYHDAFTADGKVYYRIAVVDADGRKVYSSILFVSRASEAGLVVYPNPVNNGTVTISTAASGMKWIVLIDATGKKISEASFTANAFDMPVKDVPKGVYFLLLSTQEKVVATKQLTIK